MPNRVIKESIKRSPQIDSLTWFEEVVFYRLIITADDYGCIDGRPVLLKNELFPTRENVTRKSVEDAIVKLVAVGLLFQYEVDGRPYLVFPTWEKHQRIRNKHRKYPAPPDEIYLTANCCQTPASCTPESESNTNPNPNPKSSAKRARANADAGFDEFWSQYPRKTAKASAEKAWSKIKPDAELRAEIMSALARSKTCKQWQDIQFVPYASTWLNGRRWEDQEDALKPMSSLDRMLCEMEDTL